VEPTVAGAAPAGPPVMPALTLEVNDFLLPLLHMSSSISLGELLTAVVVVVTRKADEIIFTSADFTQFWSGLSPKYGQVQTEGSCR